MTKTMNSVVYCLDIWNAILVPLLLNVWCVVLASYGLPVPVSCALNISRSAHTISTHSYCEISCHKSIEKQFMLCYFVSVHQYGNKKICVDFLYFKILICMPEYRLSLCVNAISKRFVHIDDTHETRPMKLFRIYWNTKVNITKRNGLRKLYDVHSACTWTVLG